MIYLGEPGRLVGVKCTSRQGLGQGDRVSFQTTLEGRVRAQRLPGVPRRSWGLDVSAATPGEVAVLQGFADGDWGAGPFVFVSAEAPVTNLLTPLAASGDVAGLRVVSGTVQGGPLETPAGGGAPKSILKQSEYIYFDTDVPVVPGMPVTGSFYGVGDGFARLHLLNGATSVGTVDGPSGSGGGVERFTVTTVVPGGVTHVRLGMSPNISQGAMPAVTWTDGPLEWSHGNGCSKAVVHAVSRDLLSAVPGRVYSNVGFTVTEVG